MPNDAPAAVNIWVTTDNYSYTEKEIFLHTGLFLVRIGALDFHVENFCFIYGRYNQQNSEKHSDAKNGMPKHFGDKADYLFRAITEGVVFENIRDSLGLLTPDTIRANYLETNELRNWIVHGNIIDAMGTGKDKSFVVCKYKRGGEGNNEEIEHRTVKLSELDTKIDLAEKIIVLVLELISIIDCTFESEHETSLTS